MKCAFIVLVIQLLTISVGFSQLKDYRFRQLNSKDGLSSNRVLSIMQDSYGYMWFGTDDGLNRFDGLKLTVYQHQQTDKNSLKANEVDKIVEDSRGNILVSTSRGLSVFDERKGNFSKPFFSGLPPEVFENRIDDLCLDLNGNLWIAVQDFGLVFVNYEDESFKVYAFGNPARNHNLRGSANTLHVDQKGGVWAVSNGTGVNYMAAGHGAFTFFEKKVDEFGLSSNNIVSIGEDRQSNIYLGSMEGDLNQINLKNAAAGNFQVYDVSRLDGVEINKSAIRSIFVDKDDYLWLGVENEGLVQANSQLSSAILHANTPSNPNSLSHNSVVSTFQDNSGDLWFGTAWGGLNVIHFSKQAFRHFKNVPEVSATLSNNTVFQMTEDHLGKIWICTDGGGINRMDPVTGLFEFFDKNNSGLGSNEAICVFENSQQEIVVGNWNGGINYFNRSTKQFTSYKAEDTGMDSNHIFDMTEDRDGYIWMAMVNGGLSRFDPKTGKGGDYLKSKGISQQIDLEFVDIDKSGTLVFAGYRGIHFYDPRTEEFKTYNFEKNKMSISDGFVYCFVEESDSIMWIGTGDGLNRFNRETEHFTYSLEHKAQILLIQNADEGGKAKFYLDEPTNLRIETSQLSDYPISVKDIKNAEVDTSNIRNKIVTVTPRDSSFQFSVFIDFRRRNAIFSWINYDNEQDSMIHKAYILNKEQIQGILKFKVERKYNSH